jgi:hypothetical protein
MTLNANQIGSIIVLDAIVYANTQPKVPTTWVHGKGVYTQTIAVRAEPQVEYQLEIDANVKGSLQDDKATPR